MKNTRSEVEFLYKAVETAIAAGATVVTLSDTAGTMLADEISTYDSKFKSMTKSEVRKYINNNFSDLAHRFGEKILVSKDKNGIR